MTQSHPECWLRYNRVASAILGLFLLLGALYSVINPVFESPDEVYHYPYIKHLADGQGLPIQDPDHKELWEQEGSQPPLYYALMAAVTRWINTDDIRQVRALNPHARIGIPLAQDNKNIVIHATDENFPWRGTVLAVQIIRLCSLLMGAGTVWCTYCLARLVLPDRPIIALGAMALNAFNPMFVFISASVNNDNLIILLASLILLALVRLLQRGGSHRSLLVIGALVGLACLSKLSGLALIPLAMGALALRRWGELDRPFNKANIMLALRQWICECLLLALPVTVIASWWYVRNFKLYGDPLGLTTMLDIFGRRDGASTLKGLWGEFRGFRISFWGLFGVVNVLLRPAWIYQVLDGLMLVMVAGLARRALQLWRARHLRDWPVFVLLGSWILIVLTALLRWTIATKASQGRLIFPAISAISLFFVIGLTTWLPQRRRTVGIGALVALLLLLSISAPFTSIRPAYARPAILAEDEMPSSARPFQATYGGVMRLLAFEVAPQQVEPGDSVTVTLYWQALAPMAENYSVYIHLFGWRGERLGQRDTYPGRGMYPTTLWSPGQVVRDTFVVPVREDAQGPTAVTIEVGLYQLETMKKLAVVDARGEPVGSPILTRIKLATTTTARAPTQVLETQFSQVVRLRGYDLDVKRWTPGAIIPLTLYWQVIGKLDRDYTVFIHLVDEHGDVVAQGDGPPMEGYYPTSFWDAEEALTDEHTLQIPLNLASGSYRLLAGFYDLTSGQRLPVLDAAGNVIGDHVMIAELSLPQEPSGE